MKCLINRRIQDLISKFMYMNIFCSARIKKHLLQFFLCILYLSLSFQSYASIPEPGIIMYGQIHNEEGALLQTGEVIFTLISEDESQSIEISTKIDNYIDEKTGESYSYYIQIPVEKERNATNNLYLTETEEKFSRNIKVRDTDIDYIDAIHLSNHNQGECMLLSVCCSHDTDCDGLNDSWEMTYFGNMNYNGEDDNDSDLLNNAMEQNLMTNPNDSDSDDDGIIDGHEDKNQNGSIDEDETNPTRIDTDGDNIQDGTELGYTINNIPNNGDTNINIFQPDMDSLSNTDPLLVDTNHDGIPDGVEDCNQDGKIDPDGCVLYGDLNDNSQIDISDAIIGLQILSNIQVDFPINVKNEINGNGKIDIGDIIYVMKHISAD